MSSALTPKATLYTVWKSDVNRNAGANSKL
jgi:hypothetical protein